MHCVRVRVYYNIVRGKQTNIRYRVCGRDNTAPPRAVTRIPARVQQTSCAYVPVVVVFSHAAGN